MVDQLAVDVQHQVGRRRLGEGLLRADRDPEPGLAEAAHPAGQTSSWASSWSSAVAALRAYSQVSYDAAGAPKCAALRAASTPATT
ncbi:hypothetical protein [Streptomyces sp. 8N616]|uniref:hypothetical protein n=1 Tax=Streptomyces sp. 8N616 TaxID=3457414 RepID=UPI003FCF3532